MRQRKHAIYLMLGNFILNLEEDKKLICEIVVDYLEKHTISDWKCEAALKTLVDKQLVVEPTNNNMEKLGEIYLKEALSKYYVGSKRQL